MTTTTDAFPGALQPLISALQGGLGTIPPAAAVSVIEDWHGKLSGVGSPELTAIAGELGNLKTVLTASPLDNAAVKKSLTTLSEHCTALGAGGAAGGKVTELGTALHQGASSL